MSGVSLTLDDCKALLECYQAMATAAADNDWDALTEHEKRAARVREAASKRQPVNILNDAEEKEMAALIERILFLDGEVRSHAGPALESIRKMLSGAVRGRTVHAAYGAHGP